jgi:hypothetical protein
VIAKRCAAISHRFHSDVVSILERFDIHFAACLSDCAAILQRCRSDRVAISLGLHINCASTAHPLRSGIAAISFRLLFFLDGFLISVFLPPLASMLSPQVFIRIRNDLDDKTKLCAPYRMHSSVEVVSDAELSYKDKLYHFAGVYSPGSGNEDIYADMRDRYIDPALRGIKVSASADTFDDLLPLSIS